MGMYTTNSRMAARRSRVLTRCRRVRLQLLSQPDFTLAEALYAVTPKKGKDVEDALLPLVRLFLSKNLMLPFLQYIISKEVAQTGTHSNGLFARSLIVILTEWHGHLRAHTISSARINVVSHQ